MKFSSKLRGRNSPSFFTRSNKAIPTTPSSKQKISKASAHFNGKRTPSPVTELSMNETAGKTTVKDATEMPFPDLHIDARQDEDGDSISIQTEQREDIESVVSVATEYEPDEETRDDGVIKMTEGGDAVNNKSECEACKDETSVEAVDAVDESNGTKSDQENAELFSHVSEGCKVSCSELNKILPFQSQLLAPGFRLIYFSSTFYDIS